MDHDDFAFEPVKGLPELPPEGEHILWQGRPDGLALSLASSQSAVGRGIFRPARGLAVRVAVSIWFRFARPRSTPCRSCPRRVVLGLLLIFGIIQARATVYTVTNRRIAMRIGAALTLTLNLPYTRSARPIWPLRPAAPARSRCRCWGGPRFAYLTLLAALSARGRSPRRSRRCAASPMRNGRRA